MNDEDVFMRVGAMTMLMAMACGLLALLAVGPAYVLGNWGLFLTPAALSLSFSLLTILMVCVAAGSRMRDRQ